MGGEGGGGRGGGEVAFVIVGADFFSFSSQLISCFARVVFGSLVLGCGGVCGGVEGGVWGGRGGVGGGAYLLVRKWLFWNHNGEPRVTNQKSVSGNTQNTTKHNKTNNSITPYHIETLRQVAS